MLSVPELTGALAPTTPVDAAVGVTWLPYLLAGAALAVVAVLVRVRTRRRGDAGLVEFLLGRGVVLGLVGLLVLMLADAAAEGDGLTAVDRPVWSWLVEHRSGFLTAAARVVTEVGSTVVMGALALLAAGWLFSRPGRRGDGVLIAVVAAGAGLLVSVSKPIVGRVRPPEEFRLAVETNQSFPSGHALASMAVLGVLAVVFLPRLRSPGARRAGYALIAVFVLAIGISRLYLGVHWSTDVAGGWLTGFGWLLVCLTARRLWQLHPALLRRSTTPDHRPTYPGPADPTRP